MPTDTTARRARLRSNAIGQGFQAARRAIVSLPPTASVVEVPTRAQAYLEGMVTLGRLRYLHEDHELIRHAEPLQITSLEATPQSLLISASQAGLARHIVDRDCDPYTSADVGLRVRDHNGCLELFQVGCPGSVVFNDFAYADYVNIHQQRTNPHRPCLLTRPPNALDTDEFAYLQTFPHDEDPDMWAASSLLRRLGILTTPGPHGIDCWRNYGQLIVECLYREISEATARRVLNDLSSPHLTPRWTRDKRRRSAPAVNRHHYFTVEGTSTKVQLRIVEWE